MAKQLGHYVILDHPLVGLRFRDRVLGAPYTVIENLGARIENSCSYKARLKIPIVVRYEDKLREASIDAMKHLGDLEEVAFRNANYIAN